MKNLKTVFILLICIILVAGVSVFATYKYMLKYGINDGKDGTEISAKNSSVAGECNDNIAGENQSTIANEGKSLEISNPTKVAQNPTLYYGKTVNYSQNGISDWKVFYADNENIYLISSSYLPTDKIQISDTGMETKNTYQAYWNSVPNFQSSCLTNKKSFMFTGYELNGENNNSKCVSALLNTENWANLVNNEWADFAIGSPTLEMFCASWNQIYPNQMIYCNNTNDKGYFLGKVSNPNSFIEYFTEHPAYSNTLYYPYTYLLEEAKGYWLASPSANNEDELMYVCSCSPVGNRPYSTDIMSIRPVVRLQSGVRT